MPIAGLSPRIRAAAVSCAILALLAPLREVAAAAAWHDNVDYAKLTSRLGSQTPIGTGVNVSMVEAPTGSGAYYIDPATNEYSATFDPLGSAVTLHDGSGNAGAGVSSHAQNNVGAYFFGNMTSIAPGASDITLYEANNWLSNVLRYTTTNAPLEQNFRVQNHSWVGTTAPGSTPYTEHPDNLKVLRRYDYLIETANGGDGMTAVVGVNNSTNPLPYLLAHSYNAIAVGRTDGIHSSGLTLSPATSAYGPGRSKPDIVAPAGSASTATAMVSSAAAMLYETAVAPGAAKNEVMKATLMAGATKGEFANWSRTQTLPLDDTFGAGELNVYNSYLIQLGGQQSASAAQPIAAVGSYGWDYQDRKSDGGVGDLYYNFEVAQGSSASQFSMMLAWNVKVTDTNPSESVFSPAESLQNLDLQLYDSTTSFMGSLLDQSVSAVDNVEHIYLNSLGPGTYTLKVSGAANWDYGLAWRMTTAFDEPNADFDGDGVVGGSDFLVWQRNFGTLLGAANSQGDADGDGDVDGDDLTLFKAGAISTPVPPMSASIVAAVPEPSAFTLAAFSAVVLGASRRLFGSRRR
jgi:hypothetical protein